MFFPSVPLTPVQKSRFEELWVRFSQTGSKWGSAYPPNDLIEQLYLSSQFTPPAFGNPELTPDVPPAPAEISSNGNAPARKRGRSASPCIASSSRPHKRGKFEKINVITMADVKRSEQKRADKLAGSLPQPVRPITFRDLEVIEIMDSDDEIEVTDSNVQIL